jgi:phage terminase small subunit
VSQAEFETIVEELKISGIEELPEGVGDLSKRELRFLRNLVSHGQKAKAALEAGYGTTINSAAVAASKLLRKGKILRVYQQCLGSLSKNAEEVVKRTCERSVFLHAKAMEAAQEVEELDGLLLASRKDTYSDVGENGPSVEQVTEWETRRTKMVREERHYVSLANQTDTLLASLLGKLNVNVSGAVNHNHQHDHTHKTILVPAAALDTLATMRREQYTEAQGQGGRN